MARKRHYKQRHFKAAHFAAGLFGPTDTSALLILDAGGIASEEAFGAPTIAVQTTARPFQPLPWIAVKPDTRPHRIGGAGGIPTGEEFGRPEITLRAAVTPIRSRSARDREFFLITEPARLAA